ncbi:MAG: DUF4389 domain-containing protein [Chloroflexi bacterium]|nr:MAG: DUF4389 domain-containing protein [Chloroflexota bacterium]
MTYPIQYDAQYAGQFVRRKLVIWKLTASIPHLLILALLTLSLVVVVPIGWIAILFTGHFPRGVHQYVAGVLRWWTRVQAYMLSLTDEFPPFNLSAEAGPTGTNGEIRSLVGGALLIGLAVTSCAAFASFGGQHITREISYQRLLGREVTAEETSATVRSGVVQLTAAKDPADEIFAGLLRPGVGRRFLELDLAIENQRGEGEEIAVRTSLFSLRDSSNERHDPMLVMVGGRLSPAAIDSGQKATVRLMFEVPQTAVPAELRYNVLNYINKPRVGETIVYRFR